MLGRATPRALGRKPPLSLSRSLETDPAKARGNPAGRMRGSRNRLSEAVICACELTRPSEAHAALLGTLAALACAEMDQLALELG